MRWEAVGFLPQRHPGWARWRWSRRVLRTDTRNRKKKQTNAKQTNKRHCQSCLTLHSKSNSSAARVCAAETASVRSGPTAAPRRPAPEIFWRSSQLALDRTITRTFPSNAPLPKHIIPHHHHHAANASLQPSRHTQALISQSAVSTRVDGRTGAALDAGDDVGRDGPLVLDEAPDLRSQLPQVFQTQTPFQNQTRLQTNQAQTLLLFSARGITYDKTVAICTSSAGSRREFRRKE